MPVVKATSTTYPPSPFSSAVAQEQINLLQAQEKLELKARRESWRKPPNLNFSLGSATFVSQSTVSISKKKKMLSFISGSGSNLNSGGGSASQHLSQAVAAGIPIRGAQQVQGAKPDYIFIGRSLIDTIRVLILMGQADEASRLRKDFQVPDKRYKF